MTSSPTDTRSWLAVLSLALGSFASVTAEFLPVGVLPEVAETFGISAGSAGLMMTLPGVLAALSAPGVMILAGHTDRRRILLFLSGILLVACLLSAWAPAFWIMLLSRALVGISLGAFWAMALAVAVRLVNAEKAHKAAAAVFAGVTAAMILGVPLGTLVAEHFSWRGAFMAAAAIAAVALLMQGWALRSIPAQGAMRFSSLVRFVQQAAARKSMLMITLVFAAHFGTYTYVAPLMQQAGIGASSITLILLGYGIAGFAANFAASHFIGRSLRATLLAAKLLLLASLAVLPWLVALPSAEIALILLWGTAWGALPLCLNTWNRSVSGNDTEASSAMFTFTCQVAIAIGSALGGFIVDHSGIGATFVSAAVAVLFSAVLLVAYEPYEVKDACCTSNP
ncbi:MFS transporter [Xanthomonas sp. NCPPB 3443]|uniref:MFS transporter n=1 Tax=Xanthomonas sp. NCPPB 3443 TaxID=3243407 RepID=UPI00355845C2